MSTVTPAVTLPAITVAHEVSAYCSKHGIEAPLERLVEATPPSIPRRRRLMYSWKRTRIFAITGSWCLKFAFLPGTFPIQWRQTVVGGKSGARAIPPRGCITSC